MSVPTGCSHLKSPNVSCAATCSRQKTTTPKSKESAGMAIDQELLAIINALKNTKEMNRFFTELFTPAELSDISLRWKLLKDLHQGMTQRSIAKKYGISLCKITRGSKILKKEDSIVLKILSRPK
jgi:TrpR family trp operon transcriptional repressor